MIAGSTRLKAGTAQKLVLNMLSTATMVRLGHLYDNLMIDVARTNEKLRDREKRILMEASGRDVSAVEHALRQSKHNLRLALIMLKRNISAGTGEETAGGGQGTLAPGIERIGRKTGHGQISNSRGKAAARNGEDQRREELRAAGNGGGAADRGAGDAA